LPQWEEAAETASGVYTELQCGSYIFMDADYCRNLDRDGAPAKALEPSLFVWAAVMSRPTHDRAIVDAGLKALAFDSGPPLVCDEPAATYERASDEHGRLAVSRERGRVRKGALVCRHPRQPRRAAPAITARGVIIGRGASSLRTLGAAAAGPSIDDIGTGSVRRGGGLLGGRPIYRVMLSPVEQCA
jgi:hypothetical protein